MSGRYNCEHMAHLWKWAALVILASNLVWAQSPSSATDVRQNDGQGADSSGTVSGNSAATPPPTIADSTKLEIIYAKRAEYPTAAEFQLIQGEVVVRVQVSETGDVEKAEVVSGDPILADAAVRAAKKYKFKPFIRNGKPVKVSTQLPFDFHFSDKVIMMTPQESKPGDSTLGASTGADVPKRVQLGTGAMTGSLIKKIQPVYPPEAKRYRVQGSVVLRAVIGKDGRIKNLAPISGPKELIQASIGAVQQWQYRPYMLNGEPVEVDTQITVNFALGH